MRLYRKIIITAVAVPALLSLDSCGVYKTYTTPDSTMLTAEYKAARDSSQNPEALGNLIWENVFTDPMLNDLINRALANNTSLNNARLNVDIANAQLKGAKLAFFPSLAISPNGAGASYAGSKMSWSYTIPAQVSWEADVFGKLTNSKRSAEATLHQTQAYAQAVRSQIISGVANCYYSIASVKKQLELYRTTSKLWGETVEIMENMKEAGRTTEAAVVQSKANYYAIQAGITDLEVSLQKLNSSLSLLLNEKPGEWDIPADATLKAPAIVTGQTPMSVLVCRPDVAAAERGMEIAFYTTNIAKAAFFPAINITAQGGFTNLLGGMLKNPGDWMAQLAGSIAAPIFSRGQNTARLEAAKKQQEQALNTFENTLLSACKEIEDLMVVYTKADTKAKYLTQQVDNLKKSVEYTNDLLQYSNGTYLEVITAMQSLLSAQMSELSNDLTRTQTIISLYQAMGGGR